MIHPIDALESRRSYRAVQFVRERFVDAQRCAIGGLLVVAYQLSRRQDARALWTGGALLAAWVLCVGGVRLCQRWTRGRYAALRQGAVATSECLRSYLAVEARMQAMEVSDPAEYDACARLADILWRHMTQAERDALNARDAATPLPPEPFTLPRG